MEREGEAEFKRAVMRNNDTYSNIVKPLVKGCLTGEYQALIVYCHRSIKIHLDQSVYRWGGSSCKLQPDLEMAKTRCKQMLRFDLLSGVTHAPLSLGLFEILSNKLRSTNHGGPLSLYQEACCGLATGTASAFLFFPFTLASSRTLARKQNYNYANIFGNLHHIVRDEGALALWKGSGLYISSLAAANMGMLASYRRSRDYLVESKGLPKQNAELSASIISGFSAAACSHPWIYLKEIKDAVMRKYLAGEKHAYRNVPFYVTRILTPHGGCKFYVRFLNHFRCWVGFCMIQWWIYEKIRLEE